jgi:two-component system NarL family sensor kinase
MVRSGHRLIVKPHGHTNRSRQDLDRAPRQLNTARAALVSLADRFRQSPANPIVTVDFRVAESDVPDRLKVDMFSIVQEGVRNAVKHAAVTEIRLSVAPVEAGIMLTIADAGVGIDQLNPSDQRSSLSGLGLIGMQQRVESNGGRFSVRSRDGGGTLVSAIWEI